MERMCGMNRIYWDIDKISMLTDHLDSSLPQTHNSLPKTILRMRLQEVYVQIVNY